MTSKQFYRARIYLGLTQVEFAEKLGMMQPSVSRIETGARLPTRQLAAHVKMLLEFKDVTERRPIRSEGRPR